MPGTYWLGHGIHSKLRAESSKIQLVSLGSDANFLQYRFQDKTKRVLCYHNALEPLTLRLHPTRYEKRRCRELELRGRAETLQT